MCMLVLRVSTGTEAIAESGDMRHDRPMPLFLLGPGPARQTVESLDDESALAQPGPAVIVSSPEAGSEEERPLAYREVGGEWTEVDVEAADHWVQMGPDLRSRLVEDPLATLDVSEFKQATNGGSASIITNNWVYSGSPRTYRIAGRLREFVTVLGALTRM